jgi:hypothetical protein
MSSSVLSIDSWNPSQVKYSKAKKTKVGKSVSIISSQTNKYLEISMPRLMTWGIQDFHDKEKDTHDGKFSITLVFPREGEETEKTNMAFEKLKQLESQILQDAYANKGDWWGEADDDFNTSIKVMMYPLLKYPKDKVTKKLDKTKPASISAKVEQWEGKWKSRIFDTNRNLLFPSPTSDNDCLEPKDYVPKLSNVSCTLQCAGIWIGEKSWGVSWRLQQCVVKPRDMGMNNDICQVEFDEEDASTIQNQKETGDDVDVDVETGTVYKAGKEVSAEEATRVEDSDDEAPVLKAKAPVIEAAKEEKKVVVEDQAVVEEEPVKAVEKTVKKVVKKKVATA